MRCQWVTAVAEPLSQFHYFTLMFDTIDLRCSGNAFAYTHGRLGILMTKRILTTELANALASGAGENL
ncbi:MAG: hypothetical protein V1799_07935 [bacterium]